jgi:hypothetical protein
MLYVTSDLTGSASTCFSNARIHKLQRKKTSKMRLCLTFRIFDFISMNFINNNDLLEIESKSITKDNSVSVAWLIF